jgi:hypothetical protein
MTPQERDLLTTLLARLKNAAGQPKDPEADALIRQTMAELPDAPYYLAQTVLIQDLSLHNAQNTITQLERQLTDAQQQARPASTSFLGSLFGSRQASPPAPQQSAGSVPAAGPWTRAPQVAAAPPAQPYGQPYPQQQPYPQGGYGQQAGPGGGFMGGGMGAGGMGGGGGFLRSAAATAAGVAGGALLFQGIESLFGQHASAGILGGQGMTPGLGESVVNNYYGDAGAGQGGADQDFSGGSFDPSGGGGGQDQDFSGGDPGGGQDYASGQDYSGGSFDPSGGGDFGGGQDQDFSGGDFGGDSNQC